MTAMRRNLLNLLMFQAFWFACVLGGNLIAAIALVCYVLLYSRLVGNPLKQWKALLAIFLIGGAVDLLMGNIGMITFNAANPVPLWLPCLWLGFSTLFFHGLQWLRKLPLPLIALLGALLGPLTYWTGALLSDNTLPSGLTAFIISYAMAWTILLPLFTHLPRLVYSTEKRLP